VKRAVLFLALALAVLPPVLAPVARAQPAGAPPAAAGAGNVVAQELAGRAYYTSLLALYGLQNASSAPPATRAELAQAMSEYYSNGAKATGVPTTGPAASYFTHGAEVSTIATSVMPDYSFAPAFAPTATATAAPTDAGPGPTRAEAGPTARTTGDDGSSEAVSPAVERPAPPLPPAPESESASEPEPEPAPESALAPAPAPAPESAPAPERSFAPAPALALASSPAPAPEEMTRATTILVPMAVCVGIAAMLVFIGLRMRPR
jgi:hypothetical protein